MNTARFLLTKVRRNLGRFSARRLALIFACAGMTAGIWITQPSWAGAFGVAGTRHDFSNPSTPRICEFCHTPHHANTGVEAPLWNRVIGNKTYTMYTSPTMNSPTPGAPGGRSLVCLGCHDGVLGTASFGGNTVSDKHDVVNAPTMSPGQYGIPDLTTWPNCERCHPNMYHGRMPFKLGTDLRNDHPISIDYPTPAVDPEFNTPPDALRGWATSDGKAIELFDGKVECSSCHDPHEQTFVPFLRVSNTGSAMCLTCHKK